MNSVQLHHHQVVIWHLINCQVAVANVPWMVQVQLLFHLHLSIYHIAIHLLHSSTHPTMQLNQHHYLIMTLCVLPIQPPLFLGQSTDLALVHFFDTIKNNSTPFIVRAAMDVHQEIRTLMQSFPDIEHISSKSDELLSYLRNTLSSNMQGYYITIPPLQTRSDHQRVFRY